MSAPEFAQFRKTSAVSIQEKPFPTCGEPLEEQVNPKQHDCIPLKKKLGTDKGWTEYYKKQLHKERSAHADEICRIKERFQREKETLTQKITRRLNQQHKQEIAKQKATHEKIISALKNKIIEQERELALFRDHNSGKGQSEKVSGNSLDKNKKQKKAKDKERKPKPPRNPGRKPHSQLPVTKQVHEVPPAEKLCSNCQLPYKNTTMTEEAEEYEYKVSVCRKRHIRKTVKKSCQCPGQPLFKTAPLPPKAMTQSKYNDWFWNEVILHKYYYQIPLTRFIKNLNSHGFKDVKSNTLSSGIERYSNLLKPYDIAIIEHNLRANFWRADGSRLPVFVPRENYASFNWTLWQYQTDETTVFQLSDSKEAVHVQNYFAQAEEIQAKVAQTNGQKQTEKILLSDRDSVFKTLWFIICFCWVHMRRDFIRVGRYTKGNRTWAISWLKHIRQLYRYYKTRKKATTDSAEWKAADHSLRNQLDIMKKQMETELADPKIKQPRKKVLRSLQNHWEGLTRFVDDPRIPMDNNYVERIFRLVANLRKTSYGVHSEKFGHITARFLTIFTTLDMHNINVRHFLEVYMEAAAENGGKPPPNIADFLPWSMSEQVREKLRAKSQGARDGPI